MRNPTRENDGFTSRLRQRLLGTEGARISTSSLGRLWRTGRGLGAALLGGGRNLDEEDLGRLVAGLGELKGVAMKAGQMLSYVGDGLPAEVRSALALLQTAAPATSFARVRQILSEEVPSSLGLNEIEPAPVAVASIGQVHRARLGGVEVAVKVRHPDIEEALAADFRSAKLGGFMGALVGASTVKELIEEARTAFLEECDFALEGSRQRRFAERFAGDPDLDVPAVEWASPRVLITRWRSGLGLEELLARNPPQAVRDRLGEALFRFWFRTLYREGLFHGDPHPGNFAFTDGGKIVVYDYGCVREFAPDFRRAFARLAAATRADDVEAMGRAFGELGGRAPDGGEGQVNLRHFLRGFFGPLLQPGRRRIAPDEGMDARRVMRDKRAALALRPPGRMLFLFRLRFGLYAVLSRLGAEADWGALEASWARS